MGPTLGPQPEAIIAALKVEAPHTPDSGTLDPWVRPRGPTNSSCGVVFLVAGTSQGIIEKLGSEKVRT